KIATATTSTGQEITYGYDPSGSYLLSATSQDGTVSYTYITDPSNPLQLHALQTITHPSGIHTFFTYDALGRLANQQGDNDTRSLSYAYFPPAGYAVTDATGATTTVQTNENGLPLATTDAAGNTYHYLYDGAGNLLNTVMPDGTYVSFMYDPLGNL